MFSSVSILSNQQNNKIFEAVMTAVIVVKWRETCHKNNYINGYGNASEIINLKKI